MPRRKIAVIDSETDPFQLGRVPKAFLWGFYDGQTYLDFQTKEELLKYLSDKRYIIYAHNGGKFDYFYLLDDMEAFSEITIINGRIAKFNIGDCEFRDSMNILPIALAQYQKTKIDYDKFEEDVRDEHMPEIKQYLKDDCFYLYELVSSFINNYGVNLTLAGTAMKQWQKIKNEAAPKSHKEFYEKFNPYYYGGRVECFKKGVLNGEFQSYDINSAYPYAMLFNHPYSLHYIEKEYSGNRFEDQNLYTIFATSNGCLPLRSKTGLSFPFETETFHVTGWEINAGLRTDTLKVHKVLKEFEFSDHTNFEEYVSHFYKIKKNTKDKSEYLFAKLFMNSLYGKFAANPEKYSETIILSKNFIKAAIEDGYEFAGELGQWALMRQVLAEEKQRYYNVATAASITGFVRAYLWEHICKLRKENREVLYCDTDCIFFTGHFAPRFNIGDELGQWKKEYAYTSGAIAGKKLYAFLNTEGEYKKASKGCRLSGKQIFKIAEGFELEYSDIAPIYSVYKKPYFLTRKIKST